MMALIFIGAGLDAGLAEDFFEARKDHDHDDTVVLRADSFTKTSSVRGRQSKYQPMKGVNVR